MPTTRRTRKIPTTSSRVAHREGGGSKPKDETDEALKQQRFRTGSTLQCRDATTPTFFWTNKEVWVSSTERERQQVNLRPQASTRVDS